MNVTEAINFTDEEDTENNRVNNASPDITNKWATFFDTSSVTEGSYVFSKILVDCMPQVTPVNLLKQSKPKARLLTSSDLQMLQKKRPKRSNSLRKRAKTKRKWGKEETTRRRSQKEKEEKRGRLKKRLKGKARVKFLDNWKVSRKRS